MIWKPISIRFSGVKIGLHFFHARSSPGVTSWALAICASVVRPNRQFPDASRLAFDCWKLSRHAACPCHDSLSPSVTLASKALVKLAARRPGV